VGSVLRVFIGLICISSLGGCTASVGPLPTYYSASTSLKVVQQIFKFRNILQHSNSNFRGLAKNRKLPLVTKKMTTKKNNVVFHLATNLYKIGHFLCSKFCWTFHFVALPPISFSEYSVQNIYFIWKWRNACGAFKNILCTVGPEEVTKIIMFLIMVA
jgi:hypothetical protein